jgi:hypothetical protein
MALEGKGKVYSHAKGLVIIYVPAAIARDKDFPFRPGDEVNIQIDAQRLIIGPKKRAKR